MCINVFLLVCICTTMPGALESQKRVLYHWVLELHVFVSHNADARNLTQVLCKDNKRS